MDSPRLAWPTHQPILPVKMLRLSKVRLKDDCSNLAPWNKSTIDEGHHVDGMYGMVAVLKPVVNNGRFQRPTSLNWFSRRISNEASIVMALDLTHQ